ncbi:MAG: amidohydrolase family protein [Gemmatimonadaceae bacterium]
MSSGDNLRRTAQREHHRRNLHRSRVAVSGFADGNLASKAQQVTRTVIAIAGLVFCACSGSKQSSIAITHVSVVDVVAGSTAADNTVVIQGNRIVYVGRAASAKIPSDARLIDGRGKFLIPGLWDMHVHGFMYLFSEFAGPLMIANGVTGARDMGYLIDTVQRWTRDIAAGLEVGPRLVVGARVDGPGRAKFVVHLESETDGMRAVDTLARNRGGAVRADFISTEQLIPRAAYFGLAREARQLGIPFAGRLPNAVSLLEASDSGQQSVEQEDALMRACTSRETALRAELSDTANKRPQDDPMQLRSQARTILASYDPVHCQTVMATLARNHTWVTPSLVAYQPYVHNFDSASTHPERSRYVPGIVQGGWLTKLTPWARPDSVTVQSSFSFDRTAALQRAGVGLLAGTDAPRAFIAPGFSLHDELALLVQAGLTPLQSLRTATYNPAAYLGALDSLGTVGQGKVADLVLLDANPLVDIRNTRRISVVIANGRVFDSTARADLLARLAAGFKR